MYRSMQMASCGFGVAWAAWSVIDFGTSAGTSHAAVIGRLAQCHADGAAYTSGVDQASGAGPPVNS